MYLLEIVLQLAHVLCLVVDSVVFLRYDFISLLNLLLQTENLQLVVIKRDL